MRVDSGRWKFVTRASITLNFFPGYINISVQPVFSDNTGDESPAVSKTLVAVVPTDMTRPPRFFV